MLGFPTETKEEMMATLDYVLDPAVDFVNFHVFNPFEGTDIYEQVKASGVDTEKFTNKYDYYTPNFSSSATMSDEEFSEVYNSIVHRFYSEPERILKSYDKWKVMHKPPKDYYK